MKKIVVLAIVVLLFSLLAAPVSAQDDHQVIIQGSAHHVELEGGFVANMMVYINTETGIVRNQATFPGGLWLDGQHVVALVGVGEVEDHTIIDDDTVIVYVSGQSYLLPSRDIVPMPSDNYFKCTLTGPGTRGEISLISSDEVTLFTIPGTIVIR